LLSNGLLSATLKTDASRQGTMVDLAGYLLNH